MTKPIANQIKETAQRSNTFRDAIIGFGNSVNRMTMRLQLRSMNVEVKEIKSKLDEQQAIKRASEALSELFVFGVFGTVIMGQAYYTNRMEEARQEEEDRYNERVKEQIEELNRNVLVLSQEVEKLNRVVSQNSDSLNNLYLKKKDAKRNNGDDNVDDVNNNTTQQGYSSRSWWWFW